MRYILLLIFLLGIVTGENNTFDGSLEVVNAANNYETEQSNQGISWGEWTPCSRSCGGGISRQQKRCRRKPCKGRPWNIKYKVCNVQACDKLVDLRAEQCSSFDTVPYSEQLLKWYPYYDPSRPCTLICRGEPITSSGRSNNNNNNNNNDDEAIANVAPPRQPEQTSNGQQPGSSVEEYESEDSIVVQLADKVQDGTRCYPEGKDICINGECMRVGCDMRVGSNKNRDVCGICGGDGSTCNVKYAWTLESTSACSESCGGGFKIATPLCKTTGSEETVVDNSKCDAELKPDKVLLPCNTHPCSTKWLAGEWSKCSVSCGGGSRSRAVFCIEENGNATSKLPDYKCSASHKPKHQEICNAFSCPTWEAGEWSDCSATCGTGVKRRSVECRDGNGRLSDNCEPSLRPRTEQECRAPSSIDCSSYNDVLNQMQSYQAAPVPEKLIEQPVPSQSTFIPEEWSPCSMTCGEGIRHRRVRCKIFLEFSRTIAELKDNQCSGPKPIETEKCTMEPCNLMENSLAYRIDTVGDSSYVESSLTDSFRSSSAAAVSGGGGSSSGAASSDGGYESSIKVASGNSDKSTTYAWKELGYTDCSATCLGGVQDLIITCVREDTGRTVTPLLCSTDLRPESRIRVCNDHPCPPRWNTSEFSQCENPCGLGIQTREVTCIHEVTRGTGNTVAVPNHMCPQPPPVDRQYCNVFDCPVGWHVGVWGKCSATCGGGVKKRKVQCEQVMAQNRKQPRPERDCSSPKPRTEKECNSRPCEHLGAGAQPVILSKNTSYVQDDPNKKVSLDIGGQATIFQGTPAIKIRCPVRKFDKAHIVWRKDHEELRKSEKYKINKKGALKIVDINLPDSGVYSCWAGQTNAALRLTVRSKPRDLMSNEEVLRSGNAVHQRQGAHLSSAPVNSEPFYGVYSEESQESRQESQRTTQKPRRKKQKHSASPSPSTDKLDYSVTPMHQPVGSTAASSASTLLPHLSQIITTIKNYWSFQDSKNSASNYGSNAHHSEDHQQATTLTTSQRHSSLINGYSEPSGNKFDPTGAEYDFFRGNTLIPDNTFGPDEERIFIDDDPFEATVEETVFAIEHKDVSRPQEVTPPDHNDHRRTVATAASVPTVTMLNYEHRPTHARHHHGSTDAAHFGRNQRGAHNNESGASHTEPVHHHHTTAKTSNEAVVTHSHSQESIDESEEPASAKRADPSTPPAGLSEDDLAKIIEDASAQDLDKSSPYDSLLASGFSLTPFSPSPAPSLRDDEITNAGQLNESIFAVDDETTTPVTGLATGLLLVDASKTGREMARNAGIMEEATSRAEDVTPVVLGSEDKRREPTIGSVSVFSKAKDDLVFEWVTTDWSRCSQTCGGGGFQMRGAQCTVRSAKTDNATKVAPRTVIGASLCEDAGYPVPEKVRPCGSGRCPQWHASEWSPCETSRCFNWKTAMQRREISCRLLEENEDKIENATVTDPTKCDESMRPPQRQECYNDACKGVWRVGEWSECSASCEEDGIKYRILQCVWYGTKKPAGNACRDIPRPPVMKTCKGPACPKSSDDCKDHSQLCGRVKLMGMCRVPLYLKQCCKSCHHERHM